MIIGWLKLFSSSSVLKLYFPHWLAYDTAQFSLSNHLEEFFRAKIVSCLYWFYSLLIPPQRHFSQMGQCQLLFLGQSIQIRIYVRSNIRFVHFLNSTFSIIKRPQKTIFIRQFPESCPPKRLMQRRNDLTIFR